MKATGLSSLVVLFGVSALFAGTARAQQADGDYFKYLGIAQKFAREQKLRAVEAPSSAIAVLGLKQRFYKSGDSWTVAFTPIDDPTPRKTEVPAELKRAKLKPVYFDYKVSDVDSRQQATIEVRQRLKDGELPMDARIDHMVLVVNSQFVTVRKEMHFRDGRAPATVLTNGQSNLASGFTPFPVDLPAINTNEGKPLENVPAELRGLDGFDPKSALDFQANDLYARPIRSIWRDGDIWPIYVHSPAGTAVLVTSSLR